MKIIDEDLITTDPIAFLSNEDVEVSVLRLDKIHPVVSGNKWFKLRYYIQEALEQQKRTIVTYGGAYSNHIVATAAACRIHRLKSKGIIRGEAPKQYGHTLQEAASYGMEFCFLPRSDFKMKKLPENFITAEDYLINEGGYGDKGAAGAGTIAYDKDKFDIVCCAAGTGTMMAGLINSKRTHTKILGFSVLKNNFSIENEIRSLLLNPLEDINIYHDFHFGGYAKRSPELIDFMNMFYSVTRIPTDFVYTGKLFFGLYQLLKSRQFKAGSRILVIHSGGLQGNLSLPKGTLIY